MEYVFHLLYGLGMSYLGLLSPGMLNMTALKIRIEKGKRESLLFSIGAAMIVFVQASIALIFVDFFVAKPEIISLLEKMAVFVFLGLSFFFYWLSRKKVSTTTQKSKNYLFRGMGMSSLNMLAIPYYLGLSLYLASEQRLILETTYKLIFTFGASLGTMLLFFTYVYFAKRIAMRVAFVVRNINLILSVLFLILGILAIIKRLQ
jgi:threonine/homoserine/homoserine lactone efflux protein